MKLKGLVVAGAILTGVAGGLVFAGPASAASTSPTWWSIQGQVDNSPGNGAQSWVWGANYQSPGNGIAEEGAIKVEYYNGATSEPIQNIYPGQTKTANLPQDVWRFETCFYRNISQNTGEACSNNWIYVH